MPKKPNNSTKTDKKKVFEPVVAKQEDGSIQITFNIAWDDIEKGKTSALTELGKEIDIPGFRKGKAPISKVESFVSREKLIQQTLSKMLPKMFNDVISAHKIRPAVYPKFELVSANDNETWQVRAVTCQISDFDLGNYKENIKSEILSSSIWTPNQSTSDPSQSQKTLSKQQKEQKIIEVLLRSINFPVPSVLVEEEVNSRLSRLLQQTEKLGLTLDSYLASIGKTPQSIREEYKLQSQSAIKLELILEKISITEKLNVDDKDIDEAIKASRSDPNLKDQKETPEQRSVIKVILQRRKALDFLTSLV